MVPRNSNLQTKQIPQGQQILFLPRLDGYQKEKMKSVPNPNKKGETLAQYDAFNEVSAHEFANQVAGKFQDGKYDFGFRVLECLIDLPYDKTTGYDEADLYFALLNPEIDCVMGLEKVLVGQGGDELNLGKPWPCPTCRKEWLESTECQEVIFNSRLEHNKLEELRKTLLSSVNAGLRTARVFLDKTSGEIESKNGKKAYDDADRFFMMLLHEKPKHVQQAEIQAESARIQGEAIATTLKDTFTAQSEREELERLRAENAALKATQETKPKSKQEKQ